MNLRVADDYPGADRSRSEIADTQVFVEPIRSRLRHCGCDWSRGWGQADMRAGAHKHGADSEWG